MSDYTLVGNITNIKTGKQDANASSADGKYPFFTCSKTPLRISSYSYDCECVLVAGNGDLNVKYYFGKFDAYQRTYIIEARDKNTWNTRFLYYFFEGKINLLRSQSVGGVIKYIKIGDLTSLNVPIHSLAIQRQIVIELDALNDILAKKRQQLTELDTLAQAIFYHLFGDPVENEKGWEVADLGKLGDLKNGLNYTKNEKGESLPFLGVSDFKENRIISGLNDSISLDILPHTDYYLKKNDFVFVRSNGSRELVGRCILFNSDVENAVYSGFCIRYRLETNNIIPLFLLNILTSKQIRNSMLQVGRGANISNVNQQMLSSIPIILPPLALQNQFAEQIEAIEKQKELINQSIIEVQKLFDYTMDKYFN